MMAPYPTNPASVAAARIWRTRSADRVFGSSFLTSKTVAPRIAGTAIRRLNPTAQDRESPHPSAAAMVRPLRLTPGSGANIWARPIRRASSQVVSAGPLPSSPRRCRRAVRSKTAAVIRNPNPAAAVLSNVLSIHFLRNRASGISGVVATPASNPVRTTADRR